jgi:hypothetical protein
LREPLNILWAGEMASLIAVENLRRGLLQVSISRPLNIFFS